MRAKAGVPDWGNDALRHTYGSMHYEKFQDAGYTCKQMGHVGFNMFFKHYRARVTPDTAQEFWNIFPGAVEDNVIIPMLASA